MNISCHHPESRTFLVSWLCMYLCMYLHMLKRRGRRRENTCTTWNLDKDVVALRTQLQAFSGHPACYLDAEIWTMVLTIPISTTELSLQSHHSPFKSICAFALSDPIFLLLSLYVPLSYLILIFFNHFYLVPIRNCIAGQDSPNM